MNQRGIELLQKRHLLSQQFIIISPPLHIHHLCRLYWIHRFRGPHHLRMTFALGQAEFLHQTLLTHFKF